MKFTLYVLILCLSFSCAAETLPNSASSTRNDSADEPTYNLVFPTPYSSFQTNRAGYTRLEFQQQSFFRRGASNPAESELVDFSLGEALRHARAEGLVPDFGNRPVEFTIYVPTREMAFERGPALVEEARRQFETYFPGVELQVKIRVPKTAITIFSVYSRFKSTIQNMRREVGSNLLVRERLDALDQAVEDSFDKGFVETRKAITAPLADAIKWGNVAVKAVLVGGTRFGQMHSALAVGGEPSAVAIGVIVGDLALEGAINYFAQDLQRKFSSWPLGNGSLTLGSSNPAIRAQKSANQMFWNYVLLSLARPTLMQTLMNIADPAIAAPTLASFGQVAEYSAFGLPFFGLYVYGYSTLRDKGRLSASHVDILNAVIGLFDVAVALINSNPALYHYRMAFLAPQWMAFSAVGILGYTLPSLTTRFFAVDDSIRDVWDKVINKENTGDLALHVRTWSDFVKAVAGLKDLPLANCETRIGIFSKLNPLKLLNRTPTESN